MELSSGRVLMSNPELWSASLFTTFALIEMIPANGDGDELEELNLIRRSNHAGDANATKQVIVKWLLGTWEERDVN